MIDNIQCTKEEYLKLKDIRKKYSGYPIGIEKNMNVLLGENTLGDNIQNAKNCTYVFDSRNIENLKYCWKVADAKNAYDYDMWGE